MSISLDGSEELYIAVAAVDDSTVTPEGVNAAAPATQRSSLSEEIKATTKAVEFALTPAARTVTVAAGQSATLALKVSSTIAPFPDPIFLFDDCGLDDLLPPDSGTGASKVYLPLVTKGGGQLFVEAICQRPSLRKTWEEFGK